MGRYAVFIDGGYFARALKEEFKEPRVDFRKLSDYFAGADERLRAYYYYCAPYQSKTPTPAERQLKAKFDRFIGALEGNVPRMQVRLGRLAR